MPQKEVNKRVLVAGGLILVVIALVMVLFYYAPEGSVGEAVLTQSNAESDDSESVNNNYGVITSGEYTTGQFFTPLSDSNCPEGTVESSGYCYTNGIQFTGWDLIVPTPEQKAVKQIVINAEHANDSCVHPGCLDNAITEIFYTNNYGFGQSTNWVHAGQVQTSSGREVKKFTLSTPSDIDGIIVARGAVLDSSPDPRWHSINLITKQLTGDSATRIRSPNLVYGEPSGQDILDVAGYDIAITQTSANSLADCPIGTTLDTTTNSPLGICQFTNLINGPPAFMNPQITNGWTLLELNNPGWISQILLKVKNTCHGGSSPCNPTDTQVFYSTNYVPGGATATWTYASLFNIPESQHFLFKKIKFDSPVYVGAILLAKSNMMAVNPFWDSVELTEHCPTNGVVQTSPARVCIDNVWNYDFSCDQPESNYAEIAYCQSNLEWTNVCNQIDTWLYEADGTRLYAPVHYSSSGDIVLSFHLSGISYAEYEGCCSDANHCVQKSGSDYYCRPEGEVSSPIICSQKNLYYCNREGQINQNINKICRAISGSYQWKDLGDDCSTANYGADIAGRAYCDGSQWVECILGDIRDHNNDGINEICYETAGTRDWRNLDYQCDSTRLNDVYGGLAYCDGTNWVTCTPDAGKICSYDNNLFTCDSAHNGDVQSVQHVAGMKRFSYYCSSRSPGRWIACDETRLGEGIDNGDNAPWYDDRHVCTKHFDEDPDTTSYLWHPTQCLTCAGDAAGDCIGSDILDVSTGNVPPELRYSYVSVLNNPADSKPLDRGVGCLLGTDCFYDGDLSSTTDINKIRYDEEVGVDGNDPIRLVCGDNHRLLECSSPTYMASDGGGWLCGPTGSALNNPAWVKCIPTLPNKERGGYLCSQTNGTWTWFNAFACSPSEKFKLRDSARSMCYDGGWIRRSDTDHTTFQSERGVSVTFGTTQATRNNFIIRELNCRDGVDNDNDGISDCSDPDCYGDIGYGRAEDNYIERYMISVKRHGCSSSTEVRARKRGDAVDPAILSSVDLCDTQTDTLDPYATVCFQQVVDSATENVVKVVDSIETLRNANGVPQDIGIVDEANEHISLIYWEPEQGGEKQAHFIYTETLRVLENPEDSKRKYPLGIFTKNLLSGQWLMLEYGDQHYLLSHPDNESLFSLDKLQLKHIPQNIGYTPTIYAGSNDYVFNVEGNRSIVVGIDSLNREFVITPIGVGERPAGFPVPVNLEESFEATITHERPARVISPEIGVMSICRSDNPADLQQALLCDDNVPTETLRKDEMKWITVEEEVEGADNIEHEFVVLYEYKNNRKQISLFKTVKLDDSSSSHKELVYNDFINSMVAGRRIALNFSDKIYIAEHPNQATLSLEGIKLVTYKPEGKTEYVSSGSADKVQILIRDGRINVERFYGEPPPPFQLWAETKQKMIDEPVNLEAELFTSMSSELPVKITTPNFGIISISPEDRHDYKGRFKIQAEQDNLDEAETLFFGVPKGIEVIDGSDTRRILFYYHSAQDVPGSDPIKTVSIYRMYDLDVGEPADRKRRSFSNEFINVFTKGNELALKFSDGNYYLLGYQGNSGTRLFDLEKVTLRKINSSEIYRGSLDGDVISFLLPEGVIKVEITTGDEIVFSKEEQVDYAATEFTERYSFTLNTQNRVKIGTSVFRLCNLDLYASSTSGSVCYGSNEILVESSKIVNLGTPADPILYLLEVNGRTGVRKEVNIRRLYVVDDLVHVFPTTSASLFLPPPLVTTNPLVGQSIFDWTYFTRQLQGNDYPIFKINGTLYMPEVSRSSNLLPEFRLAPYDGSARSEPRNVEQKTVISFEGQFVVGPNKDRVMEIDQEIDATTGIDARKLKAVFTLDPNYYVPEAGEILLNFTAAELASPVSRNFYTKVEGKLFPMQIGTTTNAEFISITLNQLDPARSIMTKTFREGDSRVLRLDGIPIEIRVRKIKTEGTTTITLNYVELTIKRIQ